MTEVLISLNPVRNSASLPWRAQILSEDEIRITRYGKSPEEALASLAEKLAERLEAVAAERNFMRDALERLAMPEGFEGVGPLSNDKSSLAHEIQARAEYAEKMLTQVRRA